MKTESNLNSRQEAFCREYIIDRNATQAAIRAGYSQKTAYSLGQRLLKNAEVKKRMIELESKAIEKAELTVDRVVNELCNIAFFDIKHLYDENGQLMNIHDMPEETRRAISGIETNEIKNKRGVIVGLTRKVKTNDKIRALELLGKFKQMFVDRIEERKTVEERKIIKLSGSMPDDD